MIRSEAMRLDRRDDQGDDFEEEEAYLHCESIDPMTSYYCERPWNHTGRHAALLAERYRWVWGAQIEPPMPPTCFLRVEVSS